MNPQDCNAPCHVGFINDYLTVEASGAEQCFVENIRTIRSGDDDNSLVSREAVHFYKQLIQSLFAFVMTSADCRATLTTYRINLIDKDNARGILLSLREQVTNTRRAHAYEHFHEVRTAYREERNSRLARDRLSQ